MNLADLGSDHFTGDHQFHSPILLAAGSRVVGGHRHGFTKTLGCYQRGRDSTAGQILTDSIGTLFGESLIEGITANAVRVSFHFQLEAGVRKNNTRDAGELFTS